MPARALPGFRDFYPDDAALRNHIFAAWRTVAARYAFEEYDGPPLESRELYEQKSGPEIVEQLYWFVDKGERTVALRPEMTPTLARMVAAHAQALKKPIRWFSMPQLFRYERQQRGRLREHFQLNMDLIGESGPLADAEIVAAAIDIMRVLGLDADAVRVRMSDRRVVGALLESVGVAPEQFGAAFAALDKSERVPHDVLVEQLAGAVGGDTRRAEDVLNIAALEGRAALADALAGAPDGPARGEGLFECVDALEQMGLGEFVEIDLSIVRGLAYYTGIVFELFDAGKTLRAICGGGRYDDLLKDLGGVDLPAVGFGMGDVVLGELLKERDLAPSGAGGIDVFLVAVSAQDVPFVLDLAHQLRDRDVKVEFALKEQAIARQLKLAAARPARRAVLIGPDEREAGNAMVRDLSSGTEERVDFTRMTSDYEWT